MVCSGEAAHPAVGYQGLAVVFVLSNFTCPPLEGQHANHVRLMQGLQALGFRVGMVTLVRRPELVDVDALQRAVPGLVPLVVLPTRLNYPLLLLRHLLAWPVPTAPMAALLGSVAAAHPGAVLHLEGIGLLPLVRKLRGRAVVVTTTDAWSLRQRRLARRTPVSLRWLFLRAYAVLSAWAERRYFPEAGAAQVVSPIDAAWLQQQVPAARVVSVPIALPSLSAAPAPAADGSAPIVLFWGDIRVAHIADGLRWLLTKVLPLVTSPVRWMVLGRGTPPAALQALGPHVDFVDWVDDIDQFLRKAAVVVLPDADGTGLKNRAVHAMACGVPVVGTPPAFEGIPAVDGQHAMVRATPQAFAAAVDQLLGHPAQAQQVAQAGQRFALEGYSLNAVAAQWAALYGDVQRRASVVV